MGCGASKKKAAKSEGEASTTAIVPEPGPGKDTVASDAAATATTSGSPVAPAAYFFNTHEVLRLGLQGCADALAASDKAQFTERWQQWNKWRAVLSLMVEGVAGTGTGTGKGKGLYAVVNEHCSNGAAALPASRVQLAQLLADVGAALDDDGDVAAIQTPFDIFRTAVEAASAEEQSVLAPLLLKMAQAPLGQSPATALPAILRAEVLSCASASPDFPQFFLHFALRTLEPPVGQQEGLARCRVFLQSLREVASAESWLQWQPHIKGGLSVTGFSALEHLAAPALAQAGPVVAAPAAPVVADASSTASANPPVQVAPASKAVPGPASSAPASAPASAPGDGKPQPQVFAILRNGHEVLRGAMLDCEQALGQGGKSAFVEAWATFMRWQSLHARMEEGVPHACGVFAFLNKNFDNVAMPLLQKHKELESIETAISEAIQSDDDTMIGETFSIFKAENEAHLQEEEAIMMPKVMAAKQQGIDLAKVMSSEVMPCVSAEEMPFFLDFAMRTLEAHHGGQPRARVFAHAIKAVSSADQWAKYQPVIKASLSPELYAKMAEECGFEASCV